MPLIERKRKERSGCDRIKRVTADGEVLDASAGESVAADDCSAREIDRDDPALSQSHVGNPSCRSNGYCASSEIYLPVDLRRCSGRDIDDRKT